MRGVTVGLRQPHRQIDGGVIRHVEEQDLRGADQQEVFDLRRRFRQPAFEQYREQMPQVPSRRSTVATMVRTSARSRSGSAPRSPRFELFVERALAAQHAVENVGRDGARGETGHVVFGFVWYFAMASPGMCHEDAAKRKPGMRLDDFGRVGI